MSDKLLALGPAGLILLNIVLGIAQLAAFISGIEVWLGWNWFGAVIVFFVLNMIPFGTIGGAIIAYVGATEGWGWAWWQAILLVAPFLVLGLLISSMGGIAGALSKSRAAR
jgi:Na+-transporting NADH:ubiquinone oxidoreductase subunit NqrD